jgi:hypothetical protein
MENLIILLAGLWLFCVAICLLAVLGVLLGLIDVSELS